MNFADWKEASASLLQLSLVMAENYFVATRKLSFTTELKKYGERVSER